MGDLLHIKGGAELDRALQTFAPRVEKNILRGALRAGANVFKREAQALVPRKSGALRASIRVSVGVKKGVILAKIYAGGGGVFYAHMVEGGTKKHLISVQEEEKNVNYRRSLQLGRRVLESMTTINRRVLKIGNTFIGPTVTHPGSKARPFMKPAFDNKSQAAIDAIAEYTRARIAKEARK